MEILFLFILVSCLLTFSKQQTESPDKICANKVSSGDSAVGITAYSDDTCSSGGIGCFDDNCRYCKLKETPQSANFLLCNNTGLTNNSSASSGIIKALATIASVVSTSAPSSNTQNNCSASVSPGDKNVGIDAYSDSTCASGGLGCFGLCRFCKTRTTPQSANFLNCSSIPSLVSTSSVSTSSISTATSVSTAAVTNKPTSSNDPCASQVSVGDQLVGITAETHTECQTSGGLGCFGSCRFCKFKDTPQSSYLNECGSSSSIGSSTNTVTSQASSTSGSSGNEVNVASCKDIVDELDISRGIYGVQDPSCQKGGIGCLDYCRLCEKFKTPWSIPLMSCDDVLKTVEGTQETYPATNYSGSTNTVTNETVYVDICSLLVTNGDKKVGISSVTDDSCQPIGGLGCYNNNTCRYCKVYNTQQSSHLMNCTDIKGNFIAPPDVESGSFYKVTSDSSSSKDVEIYPLFNSTLDSTIPIASVTSYLNQIFQSENGNCSEWNNQGDINVGIYVISDDTCALGGLGCVNETCRYCQFRNTSFSSHLYSCVDIILNTTLPTSEAKNETASIPEYLVNDTCSSYVSSGDVLSGISAYTDDSCQPSLGSIGCFVNMTCRYCKFRDTDLSKNFLNCNASLKSTEDQILISDKVFQNDNCSTLVSYGDLSVGIAAVEDNTCANGGLGCFSNGPNNCRYCSAAPTNESSHLMDCDSIINNTTNITTDPFESELVQNEATNYPNCQKYLTSTLEQSGFGTLYDETCVKYGGFGCQDDKGCRLCKLFKTSASMFYPSCSADLPKNLTYSVPKSQIANNITNGTFGGSSSSSSSETAHEEALELQSEKVGFFRKNNTRNILIPICAICIGAFIIALTALGVHKVINFKSTRRETSIIQLNHSEANDNDVDPSEDIENATSETVEDISNKSDCTNEELPTSEP